MTPHRIDVPINAAMFAAIDHLIEREQVSLNEAVRRLITYGEIIDRSSRDQGASVMLRRYPSNRSSAQTGQESPPNARQHQAAW